MPATIRKYENAETSEGSSSFAPILMAVRMGATAVPPWQVGLAVVLLVASIVGLTWLAGRIYANAALHLGTRVRFMEAFHGEARG